MAALFVFVGMLMMFGLVYPVSGVIAYKLCGSKKTIAEILSEL